MRTCDGRVSKSLQNARKLCSKRLYQYRMRRIEYSSSFNTSISMNSTRNEKKTKEVG